MVQKIDWRFIENFCDPDVFNETLEKVEKGMDAYKLQHEGAVYTLVTKEQSDEIETEVEFGSKYLKRYHCSCSTSKAQLCSHILAVCILYRRQKSDEQIETDKIKANAALPSRISIPAILSQVPKDELDRFIQRYARTDKKFGQALKLHFASRVQVLSPEQKYHDLIKSITRLVPLSNGRLPKQSLQSLFWISEELLLQVDDLIALESPLEAFAICYELLLKYHNIYRKLEIYIGEYEKFWIQIHQKIKIIFELDIAPDQKQGLQQKLSNLFQDPAYPFLHSPHNLFELLYPHLSFEEKQIHREQMLKKLTRKEINAIPLTAWIKQAIKQKDESLLIIAYELTFQDYSKWLSAIDLLASNHKEIVKDVGQWLLFHSREEILKYKLMDRLWGLFPDESDSIVYVLTLLNYQPDEKYIKFLLSKQISLDMISAALDDSTHPKASSLLISFYIDQGDMENAKSLLEKNLHLDLLKSYTARLYPREDLWLESMYKKLISIYLDSHVGPVPANKIQSILSYLQLIKARGLSESLYKWIKKNYQNHNTLIESLN